MTPEQACRKLIAAYEDGRDTHGIDWVDLDDAYQAAREALGLVREGEEECVACPRMTILRCDCGVAVCENCQHEHDREYNRQNCTDCHGTGVTESPGHYFGSAECSACQGTGGKPHDLQCKECGSTLNNQCLDPDCEETDDHESSDLVCQECFGGE